jgi:hypothetical protein
VRRKKKEERINSYIYSTFLYGAEAWILDKKAVRKIKP